MLSVADYEAWKAKQQQAKAKASAFLVGQVDGNPDQLAGDLKLATDYSAATGAPKPPAPMVGEYRSVFQAAIDKTRAETILSRSPRLTDWLRNPENATLAKDDLESLSFWESTAIIPRNIAAGVGPGFAQGFYNALGTVAALPGDNSASKFLFGMADQQGALRDQIAGPSGGWLTQQVAGASQSIGMMVPGLGLALASGGTATPGLTAAFIAPGAITQGGNSARAGIDAGLSPERALLYGGLDATAEVMFERIPVGRFLGDLAQGSGFGKILMGQIGTEVPTEVATTLFQNLNEWVTLNPDKPLSDFVAEQPAAVRDTIAQTLLATIGLSAAGAGVARVGRFANERANAQAAQDRVTLFQELSGQAVASKLRARMPDRFREFVERATANGPVENVYVPASEFASYFQSAGIDPYAVVDQLEGVTRDDLDAAMAAGGDLKIPTATYAASIAGSEHDAFLMENMRFDPMDMTAREAAEFNARVDDIMQEMWAEAEDIRQEDERWRAVEEKIHDQVVSQMRAAGLSTERAMAEVQPIVAFYRTRAARMGLTTEEYLARNPLPGIQGSIPQGMQFKNVDELNRTLAEARARRAPAKDTRQSLLEFIAERGGIIDRGGELKARDAEVIRRGRGRKNLVLARDPNLRVSSASKEAGRAFGPDDVAQAAIEAGYMADNPVVIEYKRSLAEGTQSPDIVRALWDAIDAELRGQKQASEQDVAPVDTAYLDEIEAYLNRLGMDLSNTDEEIRAAIERDQAAPDRMYGQAVATDQPLYVVHNLSAEKLRHAARLGGLAAPSLAVARGDIGFDDFGEISLIGDPSLANPKTKGVRLFNADVYSPRQPRARFKVDKKAAAPMNAVIGPVAERLGFDFDKIRIDEIERDGLAAVEGQIVAKAAWLESIGETVPVVRDEPEPKPEPLAGFEAFNGTDWWDLRDDPAFVEAVVAKANERIAEAKTPEVADRIRSRSFNADGTVENNFLVNWAQQVARRNRSIADYKPNSAGRVLTWNTSQAIDKQIGERVGEFNGWVREQFGGVITDMFFENEAGRKKEYTLANLVREMTRTIRNGESFNYGAGNVRAQVAPEFRSLAEVKAARGQITDVKAMDALKDEVNGELFALADKIKPFAGPAGRDYGWGDTFADFLRDVARGPRAVAEWPWSGNIPAELMEEAVGFLEKLKGLPTHYFEIKMQRAMEFSEFTAALIPDNAPADVRKILTDAGLELVEYKRGDDGGYQRNAALQQIGPKVFFQNTQGPRGQISFNMDGNSLIRLFETANLSTLQHEMGHFFLTMMQRDVATGDQASIAEYEVIKSWWRENAKAVAADGNRAMPDAKLTAEDVQRAIDIGTTGDMMKDAAIDVGMQEQWARGYEAYLMEGKAPSVELRSAFEKFRAWMISVYRSLVGLNVQINDDIRGVFDRMLATDEEIAKAKQSSGENRPIFTTAEQMGLTQEEFDRLMKLRAQAEDEAKARLLREIMEPIKRQRETWWKDEKAKVEEDVTRQVNAMPVFRALEWLGNRRWLGGDAPDGLPDMRMSKDMLIDRYGEGVLKTLPRGMQTVYTVEGGMDPDEVAGWFGFDSGDAMIRALERAPKRTDAIKAETDRVMNERHGDALNDGEIEAVALDALHTDKRGEWLAAELKAVAEVAGVDVKITMKDARATARQTIARMKVRDATAAMRFLAAERKAGEEAARLGAMLAREGVWMQNARRRIATKARAALRDDGTVDAVAGQIDKANASTGNYNETVQKLIDAKRRQLVNHALFMEARLAADEVSKAERFVQRLNKASTRERIAGAGRREGAVVDYLAAIDDILDRYDFRKMSGRAEQRRGALLDFVDAMKAAGRENELAIPEAVLRAAERKPYKTLTVEELRGVIDSLKNLQHIALRWNDLIDAQNQRKLEEVVGEITAAFDANLPKRPPGRLKTTAEALRNSARQFIDLVLNAGTILREIDGFKDMGAAYRNLKAPIDQAMDRLTIRKEEAAKAIEDLYSVYSKDDRRKMSVRKVVPGIPFPMSKWEMIAVALNTGNEGNYQRLTDPNVRGSLTPDQVDLVLNSLDARDADFVQSVWDYIGSFRDDIAKRERRTTGVEPAWVDAMPVSIGGKTLKGGYYPLKYDARLSTLARDDETQSMAEALQAGRFGKAQTKRGHLEARAKSSGRDIELDMSVFHRHVNQVIYDLELSEPVANSWKVLQSGPVRQAFMDAGRQADFDALEVWLKDVAEGQLNAGDLLNRGARRFKSNFTAAKLAFNLGTVAAQISGLSQSMVVVGKRDFLRGFQASLRPGIMQEITAKSAFMRERQTTFNKDITDFYNDPSLGPLASRWGEIKRDVIGPASFWLMTKVQFVLVDVPTWVAGYQQGLRMYDGDDAKAVEHADGIVKRAQASGLFSDRSAIERGSTSRTTRQNDVIRLFTTLGSYMFAKFNVAYERTARGARVIRQEGVSVRSAQEAISLTVDVAFLFTLEAVFMALIKGSLPGEDDDEDGDGTGDEWAAFLARETAFSVLGTIPFVRDVTSNFQGFESGGAYGGIIAELAKPFKEISQGEVDKGLLKSSIAATGLFLGLPSTQINRAVDAAWRDLLEGQDVAPVEYILGKRG